MTSKDYKNYGGRGIKSCMEWEDYISFKKWALSAGYKEGLTIERKNTNGDYCPDNCAFVTMAENNRNKRNTYWWVIDDVSYVSAVSAAIALGKHCDTITRWCKGRKCGEKYYPPKSNCHIKKKYEYK